MKKIKNENLALIIVLIIQLIVYIIMGVQKCYIHMDEAYSIGLTNYDKIEITDNEDFYNNWHTKDYYEDYISISSDEVKDLKPVYDNQKNDVHPPFYYLLLRIAYSFNLNEFSKWPGIILNIIIVLLSNIFIYKILKDVTQNKKISLIICLVVGLIISTMESVMYIRMYALNSLILLIIAYLHLNICKDEKLKIYKLILLGITTLIASLTHYYNVLYIIVMYLLLVIYFIKNRRYKDIFKYTLTMAIAAALSLIIFPHSIEHIFMGYRGQGSLSNFTDPVKMLMNLSVYIYIVSTKIFNGTLGLLLLLVIGIVVYKISKNEEIVIKIKNKKLLFITIPAFIYFIFVAISSPYTEIRYIIPISNFIFMWASYELYVLMKNFIKEDKKANIIFIIIMCFIIIMPIITGAKVDNLYIQHKEIVRQVENEFSKIPTIYIFNSNQNRFLDDIYMFTKIEESYILELKDANEEKLNEILKGKNLENGIIVWVNEGFEKEKYLKMIKNAINKNNFNNIEHIKRMNACDIYYIN